MTEVNSIPELMDAVASEGEHVLVLTQPSTCVPCRRLKPHLDKLAGKGYDVVIADLDDVPEAIAEFEVQSIPKVLLYRNGEYVRDLQGRTVVQLEKEI